VTGRYIGMLERGEKFASEKSTLARLFDRLQSHGYIDAGDDVDHQTENVVKERAMISEWGGSDSNLLRGMTEEEIQERLKLAIEWANRESLSRSARAAAYDDIERYSAEMHRRTIEDIGQ